MEQPAHGPGSPSAATAVAEPPRDLECRNPACHLWAVGVAPRENHDRCLFCGWQLAPVDAQDIAIATADGDWAVVDPEEVISRGAELRMRAFATRLSVRRIGHARPDYSEPCVCAMPGVVLQAPDLTPNGDCLYCDGAGIVTLETASAWRPKPPLRMKT